MNSRLDKIWDFKKQSRASSDEMIILNISWSSCSFIPKVLRVWKEQWTASRVGLCKNPSLILTWQRTHVASWPQDEFSLWLSVFILVRWVRVKHTKKPSPLLIETSLILTSPDGYFKKIISPRLPVVILHVQCKPQRDTNLGLIIREDLAQWHHSRIQL